MEKQAEFDRLFYYKTGLERCGFINDKVSVSVLF